MLKTIYIMDNKTLVVVLGRIYDSLYEANNVNSSFIDFARKVVYHPSELQDEDISNYTSTIEQLYNEHMNITRLCNSVHDLMASVRDYNL